MIPLAAAGWLLCATLTGAGEETTTSAASASDAPSFRNDVLPVLTKASCNSGPCHGALAGKNGFRLSLRGFDPEADYRALTREALGRRVLKAAPAHSLMLLKPTVTIAHGGGKRFEVGSEEYDIIADWIASGAPPPFSDDPVIEHIDVEPAATVFESPGETVQLNVTASYSDGQTRDVTRWTKFSTSNEGVAEVDAAGLVRTKDHGEAAVSVWFASKVDFALVTVPYDHAVETSVFETSPRNNFIDDLVLKKLAELRIPPSPAAGDEVFIRRVFLDTLGVLPTPLELDRFLADTRPDKRSRLIEEILTRPEYVDYWTYRWSDLLLVSSAKLQKNAMWAYYSWIRESVAQNKPWNETVRELLTASGSNLTNGAANYWVIHRQPIGITENLSQAFLGISLTCARCHNHPLEKWTQNQYYGMANLVSRVSQKSGDIGGEIIVVSRPFGDINHPRTAKPMPPQPLDGKALALDSPEDRRDRLADWMTSPENEYFARTLINRVWANFFGRGLVDPVDDLRATNPPSNQELFDALRVEFVEKGFDVQHLIRLILNSTTYQRSSETREFNEFDDRYHSHYMIRRLPAEVILDAISQVTGVPESFGDYPTGTRALQLPDTRVESYFLDSFGRPPRITVSAGERMDESNVAQVLHLINGDTLNRKLRQKGNRVDQLLAEKLSSSETARQIYRRALSRAAEPEEVEQVVSAMGPEPDREMVADLFWAVLTSKEFLFAH